MDNGSTEAATREWLASCRGRPRLHVLSRPGVFNYSALNNAAAEYARGDYLCFLNNDVEVITPEWLDDMVGYAMQAGVGCVGAKLSDANRAIQHGGILLGVNGVAAHAFRNRSADASGYFGRLRVASNYSAVTGACLAVKRSIFFAAGGLDAQSLPVTFNDVDLCLKVIALGYRNVVTPFAELVHFESSSRDRDDAPENAALYQAATLAMMSRYRAIIERVPGYAPPLTRTNDDFSIRV